MAVASTTGRSPSTGTSSQRRRSGTPHGVEAVAHGTVRRSRVLIVDDSAIVRTMLSNALKPEPDMEVVGLAADPFVARDLILTHKPDVITLDIEMPRMDGLTFLRQLMAQQPVAGHHRQLGDADRLGREHRGAGGRRDRRHRQAGRAVFGRRHRRSTEVPHPRAALRTRGAFRAAAPAGRRRGRAPPSLARANGLILIGASTGGTQAIEALLTRLPADAPPILIVQHMPA